MNKLLPLLLPALLWAAEPLPEDRGAAGVWQALKRLQTSARVMYLTAHPDDEDGGAITWLTRGLGAEVTLVSLTRGESGANLVTGDFFDSLGALRTLELLKAAQYYGARVRFTRFIDYGYSKNVAETWRNWDREELLRDVVRLIRMERPHVILSRWQGSPRDGHGNHEAAGAIAPLAFEAAGDPHRFPEQIAAGLAAWQPLKLYANNRRESDDWTVRIDSGIYDPVLGRSFAQMAREGLRWQRSQGAGSAIARAGPSVSYYKLTGSKVGFAQKETSFFERLDVGVQKEVARHVEAAVRAFSISRPQACAPPLAAALGAVNKLLAAGENMTLRRKQVQIEQALAASLGLDLEALAAPDSAPAGPFAALRPYETFSVATAGQAFQVTAQWLAPAGSAARLRRIELRAPEGWQVEQTAPDRFAVRVPAEPLWTTAFWGRSNVRETVYGLDKPEWFGRPLAPPPLVARATYEIGGVEAAIESDVRTSFIDRIGVQHRRELAVGPAVSVRFQSQLGVLPVGRRDYDLLCLVRNHGKDALRGTLRLSYPSGWRCEPEAAEFSFEKEGEETGIRFRLSAPEKLTGNQYLFDAIAEAGGRQYDASFTAVTYPGLGVLHLSRQAPHRLRVVDVKVAGGLRVGYLMGTGDEVPQALEQLGVKVELLDAATLAAGDLGRFDTILLGIRAYAARPELKTYNARLIDYVRRGGVLVVQYNTQEYDNNYGPYPYTMGRQAEEVSEEDSPVEILDPTDPVFSEPNRITARDFDGWVEQRGSKFWTTWDAAYKPLLATHDTGQAPQRGGWLVARHGQGLYIYCAYAWYRQLPFAVPGAVRLVANLVSLGAKEASWRR